MSMREFLRPYSLSSQGARYQFAVGVLLISIIPVLGYVYMSRVPIDYGQLIILHIAAIGFLLLLGICGFAILRQYPRSIIQLRHYVEHIIAGRLPEEIRLPPNESDVQAIERSMNIIVSRLREQLATVEDEKTVLERQLRHAEKMQSLGLMAGGIAHDFGNMMTVVMGHSELAMEGFQDPTLLKDSLKAIGSAAKQGADLTKQLLIFAGAGKMNLAPVDLSASITEIEDLIKSSVSSRHTIRYDLSDGVRISEADATQIRQVVLNLIINASDAMGDNTGTIKIATGNATCSARDLAGMFPPENALPGTYAFIEVADTGQGMDAQTLDRLFDPFYTTKKSGRGLGLAVVLGIVRGHGGVVSVESETGKGTTFRILLPCARRTQPARADKDVPVYEASRAPSEEIAETALSSDHTGRKRMRVLVFDNEETRRALSSYPLVESGAYEVITFARPEELCASNSCRYNDDGGRVCGDVVIAARMDGLEFVASKAKKKCRIPNVVLMSGQWTRIEEERARKLDCHVFHSPVRSDELDEWLKACEERIGPDRILSDRFYP